jgi:hypothetical protein
MVVALDLVICTGGVTCLELFVGTAMAGAVKIDDITLSPDGQWMLASLKRCHGQRYGHHAEFAYAHQCP